MSLDLEALSQSMLSEASGIAKDAWTNIRQAATVEIRGLAQRLVSLTNAFLLGEITRTMAKRHLRQARLHVIATIAMLTSMVEAAVEKIINAALTAIRNVVNTAIGFTLVV